ISFLSQSDFINLSSEVKNSATPSLSPTLLLQVSEVKLGHTNSSARTSRSVEPLSLDFFLLLLNFFLARFLELFFKDLSSSLELLAYLSDELASAEVSGNKPGLHTNEL
ncbi:hypothetical protein V8G54_011012, partial [Vigna mungo]